MQKKARRCGSVVSRHILPNKSEERRSRRDRDETCGETWLTHGATGHGPLGEFYERIGSDNANTALTRFGGELTILSAGSRERERERERERRVEREIRSQSVCVLVCMCDCVYSSFSLSLLLFRPLYLGCCPVARESQDRETRVGGESAVYEEEKIAGPLKNK